MTTVTSADLTRAMTRLASAMTDAGLSADRLHLEHGSKTYGRAFRLYFRAPKSGGLSNVPGVWNDGYLGMTKADALHSLEMLTAGLRMTSPEFREAHDISARFTATWDGR